MNPLPTTNWSAGLRPVAFLCLAAIALVALSGCSLKKQYPAKQAFLVEARRSGEARASSALSVLRVRNLNIAAPFEGKGFVYRTSELGYEPDFYHEFLVSPRALLTESVRQWLGASGVFRFALDPASRSDATHSLDGNVLALYGDYRESASPKAVLVIEFFLTNEQPSVPEIIFHKAYRQEVPLENRAPEALAKGWGKALEQILSALEKDLVALPK
jgi:ABC-type uncharacterized transport system auxiliary subunit